MNYKCAPKYGSSFTSAWAGNCKTLRVKQMGRCKLCYEDAGWFRKEHGHCRERHGQAVAEIYRIGVDAALRGQNFDSLSTKYGALPHLAA